MFCPKCWKEYPKGMRHCDSCRVELVEEKPEGMKEQGSKKPAEKTGPAKPEKK